MEDFDVEQSIKITILGASRTGKTEFLSRFLNYHISEEYDPTIEERYKHYININEKNYELEILDTSGDKDYSNMMDMWILFGEGFILLFDITNKESFEYVKNKYNKIIKNKNKKEVPILLVGNIYDLKEKRQITFDDASDFAFSKKIEYIEISGKNNLNCNKPFEIIAKEILIARSGKYKEYKKNIKISNISNMITERKEINFHSLFKYIDY